MAGIGLDKHGPGGNRRYPALTANRPVPAFGRILFRPILGPLTQLAIVPPNIRPLYQRLEPIRGH